MLQLWVQVCRKRPFCRSINDPPYGASAVAFFRFGADRIAGLEGEILLNVVNGGEVVVFGFAELEEAR